SFKPFLPLLHCTRLPVVQLWAVWAIHHVCSTDRARYSRIIREEKIYDIMQKLYDEQSLFEYPDLLMIQLLKSILHFLKSYHSNRHQFSSAFSSDLNMATRGPPTKVQKVMVQPINLIFRYLQNRSRIQVWLYEQTTTRIEGYIIGFDEYMNLVLDDAEEILLKKNQRKKIGRILLKGDNISLIQQIQQTGTQTK
ncbi:unnamed protein product, partial [Rotaria sp. Silwood2]